MFWFLTPINSQSWQPCLWMTNLTHKHINEIGIPTILESSTVQIENLVFLIKSMTKSDVIAVFITPHHIHLTVLAPPPDLLCMQLVLIASCRQSMVHWPRKKNEKICNASSFTDLSHAQQMMGHILRLGQYDVCYRSFLVGQKLLVCCCSLNSFWS